MPGYDRATAELTAAAIAAPTRSAAEHRRSSSTHVSNCWVVEHPWLPRSGFVHVVLGATAGRENGGRSEVCWLMEDSAACRRAAVGPRLRSHEVASTIEAYSGLAAAKPTVWKSTKSVCRADAGPLVDVVIHATRACRFARCPRRSTSQARSCGRRRTQSTRLQNPPNGRFNNYNTPRRWAAQPPPMR
jgi:hypothetical protein